MEGGSNIGRGELQQVNTVTSRDYSWRSEESALINAILGTAKQWDVEKEGSEGLVKPLQKMPERPSAPDQARPATQADIHHLDRIMVSLAEELKLHRSAIKELHVLVNQTKADLPLPMSSRHRDPWWRRWLLRFSY